MDFCVYDTDPGFDRIWDMVSTCTHRNLDIHVPVYMINITIPASENMFGQTPVMFIVYSKKTAGIFF